MDSAEPVESQGLKPATEGTSVALPEDTKRPADRRSKDVARVPLVRRRISTRR